VLLVAQANDSRRNATPPGASVVVRDNSRRNCDRIFIRGNKRLLPEDAKEASGHGVRAKRSKSGAVSFDLLADGEESHAAVQ
jgi:hypothetical protein